MEINLLALSTYNVEQIQKNKEFLSSLISQIKNTYQVFDYSERSHCNAKDISFAPTSSRICNVFIHMDLNGEVKFTFAGRKGLHDVAKTNKAYNAYDLTFDTRLEIKGINASNYTQHLANIVKGIELCEYSFR